MHGQGWRCEVSIETDDLELLEIMKQWVKDPEIGVVEVHVTLNHFPVKGEQIVLRVTQQVTVWIEAQTVETWSDLVGNEFVQESVLIRAVVVEW